MISGRRSTVASTACMKFRVNREPRLKVKGNRARRRIGNPLVHSTTMRRVVVLIALAAVAAACTGNGGQDHGVSVGGSSRPPESGAQVVGGSILDFTLPGVDGPEVRGADYAGKALALWFWAPW